MEEVRPSDKLRQAILIGITKEEGRLAKIYLFVSSFVLLVSFSGVVMSVRYLIQGFYRSGFYQYLSLLFSGDSSVLIYWKELSYSLLETIPIVGMTLFLMALGLFIWSGVGTIINARRFTLLVSQ